jgi:hypothetical protein
MVALSLLKIVHGGDIIRREKLVCAVDMTRVRVEMVEAIIGHRTGPER